MACLLLCMARRRPHANEVCINAPLLSLRELIGELADLDQHIAAILDKMHQDPSQQQRLHNLLDADLTRDDDRALFGLPALALKNTDTTE